VFVYNAKNTVSTGKTEKYNHSFVHHLQQLKIYIQYDDDDDDKSPPHQYHYPQPFTEADVKIIT